MILAGGVGSRVWPVSTPERPKQILPLASDRPLIADTVGRIAPLVPMDRVRVLTGEDMVAPMQRAVDGLDDAHFLVEPQARGTAPVLVWAAHTLARRDPDAVMVSLHADHVIRPEPAFRELIGRAAAAADAHDRLFTVGIRPTRPDTGYGYIRSGEALGDGAAGRTDRGGAGESSRGAGSGDASRGAGPGADGGAGTYAVDAFVEKPDAATAERYLESGIYLWNSGIFVWRVDRLLAEVRAVTPELAELLPLLDAGDVDGYFDAAPRLSIDRGVLERSDRVGVMDATFDWDDVGTWDAVARTRDGDPDGNVVEGGAHLVDARGCVVWNETDEPVVVFGASDTVVVRRDGVTLVLPRDRAADLKDLLDTLPDDIREAPE
ncbi:MAG: mannose-1-phosphate guanylyltransferase [Longimicrobiales bacterium]|nr:mannose-1-phosphate guanylyltransferase [Longimicrobiales bacterium]